jgi:hypothetical protein
VLDPWMVRQPVPNRPPVVTGQVVGDHIEIALRVGLVEGLRQRQIASRIAGPRGPSQHPPVADTQRPIDPHRVGSPLVGQRHLDAVTVRGPAWGGYAGRPNCAQSSWCV